MLVCSWETLITWFFSKVLLSKFLKGFLLAMNFLLNFADSDKAKGVFSDSKSLFIISSFLDTLLALSFSSIMKSCAFWRLSNLFPSGLMIREIITLPYLARMTLHPTGSILDRNISSVIGVLMVILERFSSNWCHFREIFGLYHNPPWRNQWEPKWFILARILLMQLKWKTYLSKRNWNLYRIKVRIIISENHFLYGCIL